MVVRYIVLFLVISFYSCRNKDFSATLPIQSSDNASSYFSVSKDKKLSLKKRKEAINMAYKFISDSKQDTLFYKILYKKSFIHYLSAEYDSLLHFSHKLIKKLELNENYYYEGRTKYLIGFYYDDISHNVDSAFYYYNQAKSDFIRNHDSINIVKTLLNMSYIQHRNSDFFGSKETITDAISLLDIDKDLKYSASAYNVLAVNNRKLFSFERAVFYYKKAIAISTSRQDKLLYKNNLANIYIDKKSLDLAVAILKEVVNGTNKLERPIPYARALDNLSYAQWLKDSTDQSKSFFEALSIRKQHNDNLGLIASYTHLGEFFANKNKTKAITYFNNAIKTSKAIKNPKGELDAVRFLMDIQPNNLNLKNRYIKLSDSLKTQELKVKTQFAKIQYDDKLNKEEIARLNALASKHQLEVLAQKRQKIIYLLMAIIIIISIAYYIYYLIIKHKNDKEKQVLKAEQSISKRVHDEIANDISVLTNYVEENQKLPMDFSNHLLENKLQNLYLRARDISTETAGVDLSDFKEELLNLILQYNTNHVKVITNFKDFEWETISDYKKIVVYRVVQELFVNAKKHSKCKTITLMFKDKNKDRIITYKDDGIGFEKDGVKKNGLQNAINRIENINATYIFETKPGSGFKATIVFKR